MKFDNRLIRDILRVLSRYCGEFVLSDIYRKPYDKRYPFKQTGDCWKDRMNLLRPYLLMQHLNYMAEIGLIELERNPSILTCLPKAKITKDGLAHIKSNIQLFFNNAWINAIIVGIIGSVISGLILWKITK
ncbi:hypothetical protein [Oleidesulfovibrio alaskensis]|jgi:hypothetical protein|uniref:hypothetical protein n=1 Tax=Oleidesulfovibrio alaskensis TaxID=58180 RepID=UPI0012DD9359|nr:hypothetical protein [Oleidesulfovibrio alaskensis]